jgi:hypothetical protein
MAIQFNDASQFINAPSATVLDINATDEIELNATLVDINANLDVSGTITGTGTSVFASLDISGDIDVDGTTNLDVVDIDGAVQIDNTVTVGVDDTGYDVKFFGASASHFLLWDESADELVLAADSKLSFNDAAGGENIVASADGHLEVNAGTTLDVTAPTVQINASSVFDVNGNIDVSGTYTGGGLMTTGGNIVIPDAGNIGSASDTDAIAIASDGVVTLTQKLIGTELDISGDIDVDGTTNLDATNIVGDLTVTGDTATFTSTNAEDPLIIIKDTTNDANAARLRFVKDKGAAGADDDDIGTIEFFADNDAQEQTKFALIRAEVADASDGAEGGKLRLQIASHDGEMQNGLIITDGSAEDEIDVTIGNGTASVTTIAGALVSTGTVTASTGGSSTPSFTFSGDTNTGIFKSANDTIGFTTGGTERVQIGSFGVAADTLTNKTSSTSVTIDSAVDIILDADGGTLKFKDGGVHIANIGNSSSDLVIENKVQNKDIKFLGDDDGAGVTALTLDMSEAGDAAFNRNVSLAGTLTNSTSTGGFITLKRDDTTLTDNADVGAINFETTDSDDAGVAATILGSGDGAAGAMKLRFYTGTASSKVERLTIDKDGNVGIGTGSPQTTLHVRKDDTAVVGLKLQNNTTNGIMEYQVGNDADNWFFGIDASDRFGISDATGQASQKLVITQSGDVGIGTSSPAGVLDIRNGTTQQVIIGNSGTYTGSEYGELLFKEQSTELARVKWNPSGNTFQLINNIAGPMTFATSGSEAMRIDSSGNIVLAGVTSNTSVISLNTSDGSDSKQLSLAGGGADSDGRGARARLYGNEHASKGGDIDISTGNVSGAQMDLTATGVININSGAGGVIIGNSTSTLTTATLGSTNTFLELQGLSTSSGTIVLSRDADANDEEIGGIRFANRNNADDTNLDADGKLVAAISARAITSDSNAGDDSGADLTFSTKPEAGNFAERMRIDSSGFVGIGINSPGQKLVVDGNIQLGTSSGAGKLYLSSATGFSPRLEEESNALVIYTNNSEHMRIHSTDSVQIGGSTNLAKWFNADGTYGAKFIVDTLQNDTDANYMTGAFTLTKATTAPAYLALAHNRGSSYNAVTSLAAADGVGAITFQGADGTTYLETGRIESITRSGFGADSGTAAIEFYVNTGSTGVTKKMTLESTGDLELENNLVIGTAGKGIDFSAQTPSSATGASTTSELLDHYEEGTWTPVITPEGGSAAGITVNHATYTKVGRLVSLVFDVTINSISGTSSSAAIELTGMPFNSATAHGGGPNIAYGNLTGSMTGTLALNGNTTSKYRIVNLDGSTALNASDHLQATSRLEGQFTYHTT